LRPIRELNRQITEIFGRISVRAYRVVAAAGSSITRTSSGPPLPDKASIALPFANMSGDPEQEYFADGMVEKIIMALSRIRWLFAIARNSTHLQGPSDRHETGRARARRRYVLEGSAERLIVGEGLLSRKDHQPPTRRVWSRPCRSAWRVAEADPGAAGNPGCGYFKA